MRMSESDTAPEVLKTAKTLCKLLELGRFTLFLILDGLPIILHDCRTESNTEKETRPKIYQG